VSWDPYLDLETGVLRNRLGIVDRAELAAAESDLTSYRLTELRESALPGDYDLAHLQAFHRLIFGDVYAWAGELRTVSIGKGALFCPPQRLVSHADQVFSTLARLDRLRSRTRSAFVDGLTAARRDQLPAPVP
jgi:cell filamentation protein